MSSTPISPRLQWVATAALAGIMYYVVILVAFHVLYPGINPISQLTSDYKVGPYGFLMTSALFIFGLGQAALVMGLYQGVAEPARSRIGFALFGVWAVGNLIAALFVSDQPGAPPTLSGAIARLNGPFHVLSMISSAILVSRRFKQDEKWRPFHRSALTLALVMLVEFIAVALTIATDSGIAGLSQRILVATALTWLIRTAMRLHSIAIRAVPA